MKTILLSVSLAAVVCSQEFNSSHQNHPFLGQPPEVNYLKTEDGRHYLRLKEVRSKFKKNLNVVRDNEPIQKPLMQSIREFFFGKSQETLDWESFYQDRLEYFEELQKSDRNYLMAAGDDYEMMTDEYQSYYGISLYMGEPAQEITDIVFDTGSSWLLVKSANCETCEGTLFDQEESSSFSYGDDSEMYLYFGSAAVGGYDGHDKVYMDSLQTFGLDDFEFMLVTEESGIGSLGGIMGFSRQFDHISGSSPGPLYYQDLFTNNVINDRIFALYMTDYNEGSYCQLGGYSDEDYDGEITWFNVDDEYWWETSVTGFKVKGDTAYQFDQEFKLIVDSGSTIGYIDSGVAKQVYKKMLKGTGLRFKLFGYWFISCKLDHYDPVAFLIDGMWVEIPPEIYVRDVGYPFCTLALMEIDLYGYWLMGGSLLRNYYSVWDDDNSRLGLAVRKGANVNFIEVAGNVKFEKIIKTK